MKKTYRMQVVSAAVMFAFALFATGCSSGGEEGKGSGSQGQDAGAEQAKQMDCLRSKGVQVADGGDGLGGINWGDISEDERARISRECKIEDSSGPGTSGSDSGMSQADKDKFLEIAKCMRKEGIDVPDPKFAGGGVMLGGKGDSDKPGYKDALDKCSAKVGIK
ncbi:hypothetical protein [Streptomyces sp. WZ-12]|uniref:hypothetical protein n=1 Tax=Streptomyces sp. WZ-12 TaxID=3030210 RepID=UPI0023817DD4|nr:hypothetical protein [Streptomyces sp. WZ-12]